MYKIILLFLLVVAGLNAAPKRETGTVPFTDSAGRLVRVPAEIKRIAPSGATAQMFLSAIAPELLCASAGPFTAEQAEFMNEALRNLPVIGQFYGSRDLNPEVVAGIAPDIIIDVGEPKNTVAGDMDSLSGALAIPAVHITATLRTTPQAFRDLGKLLHREEKGEALARFCEKALLEAEKAMGQGGTKPRVLYCLGPAGTNVLAKGSFHAEVLDWLTVNLAAVDNPSAMGSGNETDMEQILLWNPEIVLFAPGSAYAAAGTDPLWRELDAIKNNRYFRTPLGPYNWMGSPPSINRYLGMLWLGKLLYNGDYDLYALTAEYYRLFYGYDLTRERFDTLTAGSLR